MWRHWILHLQEPASRYARADADHQGHAGLRQNCPNAGRHYAREGVSVLAHDKVPDVLFSPRLHDMVCRAQAELDHRHRMSTVQQTLNIDICESYTNKAETQNPEHQAPNPKP